MNSKKTLKFGRLRAFVASFLVLISLFIGVGSPLLNNSDVYAVPENEETSNTENVDDADNNENGDEKDAENKDDKDDNNTEKKRTRTGDDNGCKSSLGALGWLVCPMTGKIAEAVDFLYEKIEDILVIQPISTEDGSPVYEIWKYCLGITNIVFIIFLLIVIYSQITGLGISNYGIKKSLPKLIVAAILVNLSFLICLLAVDISNIVGNSLRGIFTAVEEAALASSSMESGAVSYSSAYSALAGGSALAIGGAVIAFELGTIWMLIPVVLGAIVAVASGLITIALRQALVILLVMISPLAMVAYILPNTEKWFRKWKELLMRMLVFYPVFSLLFGASSLAGFAIIMSASGGFGILLGMAVQIFPLFFSWKLMQMSGTILGDINSKMRGIAGRPLASNRAWAASRSASLRNKNLASGRPTTPSLRLMQFMANKSIDRDERNKDYISTIQARGTAYSANRNYRIDKNGKKIASRIGERAYTDQARRMNYQAVVDDHKVNFNEGLSDYYAGDAKQKLRLKNLDAMNMNAADKLSVIKARSEAVDYRNAKTRHDRMEAAINAHMDLENGFEFKIDADGNRIKVPKGNYKFHLNPNNIEQTEEMARYNAVHQIMHGVDADIHFAAASATHGYDTQKKIVETKFQKYFDFTAPTKDLENRLAELTKKEDAANYIDTIVPGLRILNQRGDTDLVRKQIENVLNGKDGIELGTHASQSLANFLMFEVKDGDAFLRRAGKYMNLETAKIYNKNERQNTKFTLDEYITGEYEDWDPKDPMKKFIGKSKRSITALIEGTSLDGLERTAYGNLDEMLINTYSKNGRLDIKKYLEKRREIETAMAPAFISASLKYPSGSEPMKNAVSFLLGYDGDVARWEDPENPLYGDEDAEKYFRKNAVDYIKNQTPTQILGMRSDYHNAMMEHLVEQYFRDNADDEEAMKKQKIIEDRKAEIAESNKGITNNRDRVKKNKSDELSDETIKKVKKEIVGKEMRKILGETGKLAQIYKTKKSGSANNAKDWLREWVGLDNEEMLGKEVKYYDAKHKKEQIIKNRREAPDSVDEVEDEHKIYDDLTVTGFSAEIESIYLDSSKDDVEEFYDETHEKLVEWFTDSSYIVKMYEAFKNSTSNVTCEKLLNWILSELNNLE